MSAADPELEHARILLVRTSSLGDVVHSLPVLAALRRHLPRARLGWVVEEAYAPLLGGHPDLDQLIVVRLRHWGQRPWRARPLAGGGSEEHTAGLQSPDHLLFPLLLLK